MFGANRQVTEALERDADIFARQFDEDKKITDEAMQAVRELMLRGEIENRARQR